MKLIRSARRFAAVLLCLTLCLSVLGAQAAEKQNITLFSTAIDYYTATQEELDKQDYLQSITAVGDTLYLLASKSLLYWRAGMTEPAPTGVAFDQNQEDGSFRLSKLITDGKTLYALDQEKYTLYQLEGDDAAKLTLKELCTLQFNTPGSDGEEFYYFELVTPCVANGYLFASVPDYSAVQSQYHLWRFDLATGEMVVSQQDNVHSVTPYKEGQLLCKVYDENTIWDNSTQTYGMATIAVYDIATDSFVSTVDAAGVSSPYSFSGLQYDEQSDTLYYMDGADVMSVSALTFPGKLSAYMPSSIYDSVATALLSDGMYCMSDGSQTGVVVRGLDMPGLEAGALTIYGEYGTSAHAKFVKAHPDMAVTIDDTYTFDMEKLASAMIAGEGMDVLRLDVSYSPLDRLIDKGYALDLSGYPQIADKVKSLYPELTACLTRDGKLYGLPVSIYSWGLYIDDEACKEIGLTPEDIPTNLYDLMDFVANWDYDYGEDYPDVKCMDDTDYKNSFLNRIMEFYVAYCKQQDQPLSFNTELFRSLITKLDQTQFPDTGMESSANRSESDWEEFWNKRTLMYWGGSSLADLTQYQYNKPNPISLTKDTDPIVNADMSVLIVNSKTTRIEQAVTYLTEYFDNLSDDPSFAYAVDPSKNEPMLNPRFESDQEQWKKYIEESKKYLETCEPSEKQGIESNIEYYQNMIDNADQYRYLISSEDITLYREKVAPYLVVTGKTALNSWDKDGKNELYTQMEQYLEGAINADQFIKEIDKRVRMMTLEDQ